MTAGAPTLDTVARLAGVSRQTVSNVLHRPERVRPTTRQRVLDVVAQIGYRPSAPARQLAMRRATAVAVPAHRPQPEGVSGLLLDAFLHALAEHSREAGTHVVLYPGSQDDDQEVAVLEDLLGTGAAGGVVLTGVHADDGRSAWLARRGTPLCTFGRPWGTGGSATHDWVDVDGAGGSAQAVGHLATRGRRRVGFLGWPVGSGAGDDRRHGWARESARLGVAAPDMDLACEDVADAAQAAVSARLASPDPPDALVCASDTLALGAWRACRDLPDGPEVVGYDATPVTAALGIASVAQPVAETAHRCLELVRARMAGATGPPVGVLLPPRLVLPIP
ncbi:MAG: LacI family DNA-binding transcriptional regulator [Kineosporiaceae bacterium]